ncbi:MAG: TonB-dependent receptor [Acidobacteriota bacterium]|nr:MAG: TonB-dependent receptor [Acidobacteriota bacterium]
MRFPATFIFLFFLTFAAYSQIESIGGTVSDPDGSVVRGANVTLRRGAEVFTTTTDDQGRFSFPNARDGKYLLTVSSSGFSVLTRDVSGGTNDLDLTLQIANASETVVVQAEVDSYLAESSTTGTKLDIPQRDLPQSVSVVTKNILEDRLVVRLTEAGDNVAGVRSLTGYSGTKSNNYIVRGFNQTFLSSSTLRNGFSEYAFLTQRDTVNVDRIEFLKGPASLLYGSADVGGLINTITKKPLSEHRFEVGLTAGGFGMFRPTFDATGPINSGKSLLYRVNFAFDSGDSYRDLVNNRNIFVAPSLTWKITDNTTLLAELETGRFRNDFDRGFPTEPEFLDEERSNNYAEPWTSAVNENLNIMLNLTHVFNEKFSFRSGFNHVRSQTDLDATSYGFFVLGLDRRTISRTAIDTDEYSENYNSQNEFYARFSTGGVRHQLVAGGEFARFQFKYLFDLFSLASIDRITPVYGATRGFPLFGFNDDSKANQFGGYVQDHIEVLPNLKFLIGGRFSYVDSTTRDFPSGTLKNEQTDQAFTPRAGVVYQPLRSTSVYFSFTSSFAPNFQARSESGDPFEPTTGRLFEAGVKQSFLNDRVLATVAVYQLSRRNVLVPDPLNTIFSIQTGEQRSRGVEVEINGQVTPGLSLNVTYSGIDAIVSEDTRPEYVGDRLVGVPVHSGGVYANYIFDERLLRGFSVGGGVYFATDQYSNLPNRTFTLPGYTRADVNIGYRRENWRFDLAIKNLNDARYFETGGFNTILPQAPRHAIGSVTYSF